MTQSIPYAEYPAFLAELKTRIQHARLNAGRAVNRELILLYWDIGRGIVEKQSVAGCPSPSVRRLGPFSPPCRLH